MVKKPNPSGKDFVTIENYCNYPIWARLSDKLKIDDKLQKIPQNTSFTWQRKFGKRFLLQIERIDHIKNGPIFKIEVGKTFEFDERNDLYDISTECYVPLSHYDFNDAIKGKQALLKEEELEETKLIFFFFNYSFRNFNVTFNGITKKINRYEYEKFYSEEKEDKKLIIKHNCAHGGDMEFQYTVKSFLSYTFDSAFNLVQDNNMRITLPNKVNLSQDQIQKIVNEGNTGIYFDKFLNIHFLICYLNFKLK